MLWKRSVLLNRKRLAPLPPKKAKTNGKHQPHEEILDDDSWPALGDPLPLKKAKTNGKRQLPHDEIFNDDTDQIDNTDSWPVLDTLPPKKAEKNGKRQPHEEILNDDNWPTLDPLPPKKAKTNGKCQSHEDILTDNSRPALDPLPTKKKGSVGWVYLSEEGFKASRTPVRVPAVLADDQGHPTDLFLTISVQQRKFCWLETQVLAVLLGSKVLNLRSRIYQMYQKFLLEVFYPSNLL